jgi:hypothetical protein
MKREMRVNWQNGRLPSLSSCHVRIGISILSALLSCAAICSCTIPTPPAERLPSANQLLDPPSGSQLEFQRTEAAQAAYKQLEKTIKPADRNDDRVAELESKPIIDVGGSKAGVLPLPSDSPTVQMLIEHVTCELYRAAADHINPHWGSDGQVSSDPTPPYPRELLWAHLLDDNFVAAIDMTLSVTHTEGLNPSLSFITPLYNGTTFSRAASVGGQLALTQDQDFDVNYVIDMGKLLADPGTAIRCGRPVAASGAVPDTAGVYTPPDSHVRTDHGLALGLEGDLGLADVIANGLVTVEATKDYNLYGTSGPKYGGDTSNGVLPPSASASSTASATNGANFTSESAGTKLVQPLVSLTSVGKGKAGGASKSPGGGGGLSPTISFSSTIDFDLVWGLNGGYNWTLMHFKGPMAGGGGGGGGSSGASGGGGGGNSSLVSFSRTTMDTLAITFSPTCRNDTATLKYWMDYDDPRRPKPGETLKNLKVPFVPGKRSFTTTPSRNPADPAIAITELDLSGVHLPEQAGPFQVQQSGRDGPTQQSGDERGKGRPEGKDAAKNTAPSPRIIFSVNSREYTGGLAWKSGYIGPDADFLTLQGTVTGIDPGFGDTPISLEGRLAYDESDKRLHYIWRATVTSDIGQYFETEPKTTDYWQSIAGCSTVTAGDQRAAVSGAQSQNLLVRLFRTNSP